MARGTTSRCPVARCGIPLRPADVVEDVAVGQIVDVCAALAEWAEGEFGGECECCGQAVDTAAVAGMGETRTRLSFGGEGDAGETTDALLNEDVAVGGRL